jgi:hypothetical protein|tara:strand:- start:66 stop:551 length:486 start_codon:yes stop_codon:yes gene_type:complete
MAGKRGGRGNVGERRRNSKRDEEFELMYGDGTQGKMTGYTPLMPWNADANKTNAINEYNKYHLDEGTTAMSLASGFKGSEGMLSGAWDKIKGFGKHLADNNPVSLRMKEVQAGVDEYDNYWLTRLGHPGSPTKEDYNNEADFDNDYRKYWDERPLDYNWFN